MYADFDTKEVKLMIIHLFMAYKIKSLLYLKNLKWETMKKKNFLGTCGCFELLNKTSSFQIQLPYF